MVMCGGGCYVGGGSSRCSGIMEGTINYFVAVPQIKCWSLGDITIKTFPGTP